MSLFLIGELNLDFENESEYDRISLGDQLVLPDVRGRLERRETLTLQNKTTGEEFTLQSAFSDRQIEMLLLGGLLDYTRQKSL